MPNNKVAIENIISMLIYIEKWMKFEIIVAIPLFVNSIVLCIQNTASFNFDDNFS